MNKDWTGNPAAPFATLGASNHSSVIREEHDFYATDPSALLLLSRHHDLPLHIWEPCCGTGHLVSVLESLGREVCSTDLVDRGFGRGGVDFFQQTSLMGGGEDENYGILTNPPYRYATEFVRHALALLREGQQLILLLKTTFLEGQKRYESIFKNTPPRTVYQHVRRIECAKNGNFHSSASSAVSYAWFVWVKGYHGPTEIRWLPDSP